MTTPTAIQYFSRRVSTYEERDGGASLRKAEFYKNCLGEIGITVPKGKLLDVGIATGILAQVFEEDGHTIYGVDGSIRMLDECIDVGIDSENLVQMDLTKHTLPFDDDTFEITVTSSTLFYLQNACEVVRDMIRVTKPDGIIIIDPDVHNAEAQIVFTTILSEDRPKSFVQSGRMLNQVFKESGVEILLNRPQGDVEDINHGEHGSFKIANNVFILRKIEPIIP